MTSINEQITIMPSEDLAQMHLSGIVGRKGRIAEKVFSTSGGLIGYMVYLDKSFQGECLWFVPSDSIDHETDNQ